MMKKKTLKMMALATAVTLSLTLGMVAIAAPGGMGGPQGGPSFSGSADANSDDSMTPPAKPDGDDKNTPPAKPDGDDNNTPPAKPDGNDMGTPPAKPDGSSDNNSGQQPPQLPGGGNNGMMSNGGPGGGQSPEERMAEMKEKIEALEDGDTKTNLLELADKLEEAMKAEQEAREAFMKAAEEAGVVQAPPTKNNSSTGTSETTETSGV